MATNKKRVFIPHAMTPAAAALLQSRDDIEIHRFDNLISGADFDAMLDASKTVNAAILGATAFSAKTVGVARGLQVVARIGVGYDAVDVAALTAARVPLMTTGIANSPSVAEQAVFFMLQLAKRGTELNALVHDGKWAGRTSVLRPHRHAHRQTLSRDGNGCLRL
jgi:D-3-phosphoglycerate dehydrogenase / 2-oxoglutarate reductase